MCADEKIKKIVLKYLPVAGWQVIKSFEVLIISVLYVKNKHACRSPINLYFKPAMN